MTYKDSLIHQIEMEVEFQNKENRKGNSGYLQASAYHTTFIEELLNQAKAYPNFIEVLLDKHIEQEEAIFGIDTTEFALTQEEKGRIYSLIRCKHLKRMATEESQSK